MSGVKKKIVLFADVLEENFDGVSVTLHKILRNIPRDRFEVLIITPHPPRETDSIDFQIITCKYLKVPAQKGYRMGVPNKDLKRAIDAFQPDLIHFTSPSLLGKFAIRYGKRNHIPVICIYHTHFPAYLKYYIGRVGDFILGPAIKYMVMWYYRNADLTLVPTKPIRKDLRRLGVPKDKMKVWGRAIEPGSYHPEFRDENLFDLFVPKENKKVLFVSRLIKEKDMPAMVKIYKRVRKNNKKITFVITGDGPKRDWLENKMRKAVFTGKKTGEDLARIYASSDLFLFPSSSETFGNVVIEAMASGLPVISADAGGPSELVKNKVNGFLVKSGKSKEFAKRITQLLENTDLHREMSQAARASIESRSIESLHEKLWNTYDRVIANHHSRKSYQSKIKVASLPSQQGV